ncbi:hypothetical protein N0380_RS25295 [Escherichia coli]|nr:hypothetical protein [Escherichia coli]
MPQGMAAAFTSGAKAFSARHGGQHLSAPCGKCAAPEEQRARPQRARGKGGTPVLHFPVFLAPVRARPCERLTTHKNQEQLAASSGASSTVDFCGWSGVSLTGAG